MVRVVVAVAAVAVAVAGCKRKDKDEEPPTASPIRGESSLITERGAGPDLLPAIGEMALVAGDGALYTRRTTDAGRMSRGRSALGGAFPARVVATDPKWTELELVPHAKDPAVKAAWRCTMTPGALWNLRLRVFARTSSLLYTVAKPVYRRYEDGTAVRVVPGVPMFPTRKAKHYWAGNEITQTAVELEPAQVRRSYAPAALAEGPLRFDAPPVAASLSFKGLASGTGAVLDSGRIPARLVERAADEYRNHLKAAWKHPTGALADVLHPCIAIRAVFGIDTIAHEPMLIDPGTMGRNRGPSVAANTTMYWRDGTRAGSTSASTPLGVPRPDGHGRACSILHFDWAVGMVPSRRGEPMHLCVERPK